MEWGAARRQDRVITKEVPVIQVVDRVVEVLKEKVHPSPCPPNNAHELYSLPPCPPLSFPATCCGLSVPWTRPEATPAGVQEGMGWRGGVGRNGGRRGWFVPQFVGEERALRRHQLPTRGMRAIAFSRRGLCRLVRNYRVWWT